MARVHKLLITSCLKGIAIGWSLLALIFIFDIGGLRTLILGTSDAVLAIFLLAVGFAITFGNAAMGHAMMTLPKRADRDDAGGDG